VTVTLYGIRNCDTVKKARAWLDAHGIGYQFHDYKIEGIDRERLEAWCRLFGWETVCNRAGTTYHQLSDADKRSLDAAKAIGLMQEQPTLIKRPMLRVVDRWYVGFSADSYARAFERKK
jgi:arsenate reductase